MKCSMNVTVVILFHEMFHKYNNINIIHEII